MPTISFPFPLRGRVWRLRSKPADLRCMLLQPPVLLGQAFPLLRQPNGVGVPGPLSGGGPAVKDGAAVPRPEQVRGGPDLRAPLVPADLPRLSERQVPTAVLESLQVEMGDPAELRHPGGHDHAAHGFALAALLENRKSLTDEREPMLELRVHGTSLRSLVTTRKYTLLYVRATTRASRAPRASCCGGADVPEAHLQTAERPHSVHCGGGAVVADPGVAAACAFVSSWIASVRSRIWFDSPISSSFCRSSDWTIRHSRPARCRRASSWRFWGISTKGARTV